MLLIGIDCGKSGALCALTETESIRVYPTPVVKAGGKVAYDILDIRLWLQNHISLTFAPRETHKGVIAILERQAPLPPKMGGSLASYWRGAGQYLFEGLLVGMQIPYEVVHPETWQKEFFGGLSKDLGKQRSVIICKRLFPGVNLRRTPQCRKDDDGIADAILIAEWGRRKRGL